MRLRLGSLLIMALSRIRRRARYVDVSIIVSLAQLITIAARTNT